MKLFLVLVFLAGCDSADVCSRACDVARRAMVKWSKGECICEAGKSEVSVLVDAGTEE